MRNIARYLNAYLTQTTASSTLASLKDLYKEMPLAKEVQETCQCTCDEMPHQHQCVTNVINVGARSPSKPPNECADHWPRWERLRSSLARYTKKSSQHENPKGANYNKLPFIKMTERLQKQIDLDIEQLRFSTAWFQD